MAIGEMTIDELLDEAEAMGFEFSLPPALGGGIEMITPVMPTGDGRDARCLEICRELHQHWPGYEAMIEARLYRRAGVIR